MGWPRTLVLVRHAESEGNILTAEERAVLEVPTHRYALTVKGRRQAELTGEYVRDRFGAFNAHYVSYYERSQETMRILFPEVEPYEDPRLAEAQRGIWHTMTRNEMMWYHPGEFKRKKREGLYHYRPLGGENWPDIELRIHSFLGTLARDYDGQNVLIVGHGNWMILFQRLVDRFSIDEAVRRREKGWFANASVTVYEGVRRLNNSPRLVLKDENIVPWEGKL
jgi:2,3-bisphosphoglycerate-dependent phosphoglycerate mutase